MAFDVSGLAAYIKQESVNFLSLAQLSNKTAKYVTTMANVKYKENLHFLESSVTLQAGNTCDDSSGGTTTLTAREVEVTPIKDVEFLCHKDFLQKFLNKYIPAGSDDSLPTEVAAAVVAKKAQMYAAALEVANWQGDTGSGTANLARFNGWVKILDDLAFGGAGDPIDGNPTTGGDWTSVTAALTSSNVIAAFDKQEALIPEAVKTDDTRNTQIVCFCGYDVFSIYTKKLRDLNLFHFPPGTSIEDMIHPGTNMKIVPVSGLTGTNKMVTTWAENLVIGCDVTDEELGGDIKYIEDKTWEGYKFKVEFKHGVQIAFPDECVYFKLN